MDWVLRNLKSALLCGWLMVIVLQLSPAACPGADPVPAERSRASLFFHVVREGKAGEVQKLIESGVDVNVRDGDKWTPLQWAAERNQLAVMRLLIKAGADVKAEHYLQGTALHIAAIRCPAEALRDLIKAGADVNSASSVYGPTALHCAAEYNNAANVKVLIDAGATIDSGRMTALTAACRNAQGDNTAAIQMLIEAGANLDPPGNSPLHWVRSPLVAKLLIDAGADVNHRNELGESPLHLAPGRHWGPRAPEFHLLIAAGAEINARDKTRSTPLHRAVMCELPEVVQV
ncbi:MAG: hypothetical protein JWN70_2513, partial [Planctomycetaceae bacterium]|nr:hypothetical protein [Planctomycetaceae bacterium]